MKDDVILYFDKIIVLQIFFFKKNEFEACYSTLPHPAYRPGALENILKLKNSGKRLILKAQGDERVIKEALWVLHACQYFDEIVIEGEWSGE